MLVSLFDYDLPPERIALAPVTPARSGQHARRRRRTAGSQTNTSRDLPDFLRPGDAVVVNDTRVIAARLSGVRVRGEAVAHVEVTLIKRVDDSRWRALARPAKKLKIGERIRFGEAPRAWPACSASLDAEVEEKGEAGEIR